MDELEIQDENGKHKYTADGKVIKDSAGNVINEEEAAKKQNGQPESTARQDPEGSA